MTTDAFLGWLHDLRYSRMVCMLLPMGAVMGYPIPVMHSDSPMLMVPFFERTAEEAHLPCGWIAVPYGGDRIVAFSAARWLGDAAKTPVCLYNGEMQRMDAYYSRLAEAETPDAQECGLLQQELLSMLMPALAEFYKSIISF